MTLGSRIKFIRKKLLSLNQTEFALLLEVTTPAAVSNWEKDLREPEISILIKMAKVSGVRIEWLLTEQGNVSINEENPSSTKPGVSIYLNLDDIKTFQALKNESSAYGLLVESIYQRIIRQLAMKELDQSRQDEAVDLIHLPKGPPGDDKERLEKELIELRSKLQEAQLEIKRLHELRSTTQKSQAMHKLKKSKNK